MSRTPEVESHGILDRAFVPTVIEKSRRVTMVLEARQAPRLCLVGVDREGLVIATAGMDDVVDAAAERTGAPLVENVEGERGVGVDGRLQRPRQLPGLEADACDIFAGTAGGGQRNAASVAGDGVAAGIEPLEPHLQPLDRGIDEARSGAGGRFLAQHVPGLERLTQFQAHAAMDDLAVERKAKFARRVKPLRIEL